MFDGEENQLLLTVKSLTQNRKQKNYIITIENHNIQNQLTIQNVFAHNYQYVYKLWACQPFNRELIKITMFQKVKDGTETAIVKRGEAAPLVKYSYEGQRFQFYGSFNQKCVLVLKFRVDTKQNIQEEVNDQQLERMNRSLQKQLQINKDQSLSYKNYLDYTHHLLQSFNDQPPIQRKERSSTSNQRVNSEADAYSIQNRNPKSKPQQTEQSIASKNTKVGSLYSPKNLEKQLSRDKYLNSTLDLDIVNLNSQQQDAEYLKKESRISIKKDKSQQISKLGQLGSKRVDMSSQIQKRREKYIGQKVQPIIKKPSESPLLSFQNTPTQQNKDQKQPQKIKTQPNNIIQFSQSFARKQPNNAEIKSEQLRQSLPKKQSGKNIKKQAQDNQLSASKAHKNEQKREKDPNYSIVRSQKFPLNSQRVIEGKQFGAIRRKKTISLTKSAKKMINEEEVPKNSIENQQFQPNITHYSIHSKIGQKEQTITYNLTLQNFKAVLYAGNKTYPKKLVIIFQDSRYSTSVNNCISLTTQWRQRFGIKHCKQNSYIYFKLISVGHKQRQEGQSQVIANDLINCLTKVYRSYFFVDDLAVGYLQFEFEKVATSGAQGWKRQPERNSISLPQLKKKTSGPSQLQKRRSSLNKQPKNLKQFQRESVKLNKQQRNPNRKSVALNGNYSEHRQLKSKSIQPEKQKLLSKIRQKKMQLKAKLK